MIFSISTDNNITTHDAAPEASEGVVTFTSQRELADASKEWPTGRFVEIWNSLAGTPGPFAKLKEVKKFTDRKTAVQRIWNVVHILSGDATKDIAAMQEYVDAKKTAAAAPDAAAAPKAASPKQGAAKAKKAAKESKPAKAAKAKPPKEAADRTARAGTMKATVIAMLQRKGGATLVRRLALPHGRERGREARPDS